MEEKIDGNEELRELLILSDEIKAANLQSHFKELHADLLREIFTGLCNDENFRKGVAYYHKSKMTEILKEYGYK